jgi:hypothetical protein
MFDEIRCKMPLPVALDVEHREHWFQTKDLACMLDRYEIREDGTLWKEECDYEDRSNPNAEGLARFYGCLTRVNKRWIQCITFTGEIAFYAQATAVGTKDIGQQHAGWIEFSTYFVRGELKHFELVIYKEPDQF